MLILRREAQWITTVWPSVDMRFRRDSVDFLNGTEKLLDRVGINACTREGNDSTSYGDRAKNAAVKFPAVLAEE